MRKLRTQAIGQVRPRACDLRGRFRSRSRRSPWGQLAMRHRRREARARSFDRNQLLIPPLRRRLAGDGFRTGFAASVPFAAATSFGRSRMIGAAILNTIALSSLQP
jgi:hypothetical protein